MFLIDSSSTPEEFYTLHSEERTLSPLSQRELSHSEFFIVPVTSTVALSNSSSPTSVATLRLPGLVRSFGRSKQLVCNGASFKQNFLGNMVLTALREV